MPAHGGRHGRLLDHCAVGGQIALEYRDGAVVAVGVGHGADHLRVVFNHPLHILAVGFSVNGHLIQVDESVQLAHHGAHAAGLIQILSIVWLPEGLILAR